MLFVVRFFSILILSTFLVSCFPDSGEHKNSFINVEFKIVDLSEKPLSAINSNVINLKISNSPAVNGWCISESQKDIPNEICTSGEGSDNGWYNNKPSSFTLSNGDGKKTIYFWYRTAKDKIYPEGLVADIVLDTTSPVISLSAGPIKVNSQNQNAFSVAGSCEETDSVIITVNSKKYEANCNSNTWVKDLDLSAFSDGTLSVSIKQIDVAGNVSNIETASLQKDTIKPILNITAMSDLNYINSTNQNNFTIDGDCSGADGETVYLSGDITSSTICNSNSFQFVLDFTGLSDTIHSFELNVQDSFQNAANSKSFNLVKDSVLPSISFSTPTANSYVNQSNVTSLGISGTCSDDNSSLKIISPISLDLNCTSSVFNKVIDLSGIADGSFNLEIQHIDAAGNSVTSLLSLIKDTVAPNLTQSAFTGSHSNQNSVAIGGSCDAGVSIILTGNDNTSINCAAGSWNYITGIVNTEEKFDYNLKQTDLAGNTTSVDFSWTRDVTLPVLSSTIINNNDEFIGTVFAIVKVSASDDNSVASVRFHVPTGAGDCQAGYADDNWIDFLGSGNGHSFEIPAIEGTVKVCAWVKDIAGNVTTINPSAGTQGINMDTISYEVGNPPIISSFTAVNNTAGPNFGTHTFNAGDQVLISFNVTDVEGLSNNPISIHWTSDNITWTPIVENYGGLSGNPTSFNATYTSFNAPSNSYFRIKLSAIDLSGNNSITAMSKPKNTGNWQIYAGSKDKGIGGSARAAQLFKGGDNGGQSVITNPFNNDMYILSYGTGLLKFSASTGKITMLIPDAEESNFNDGDTIDPNTHTINAYYSRIEIAADNKMYLSTSFPGGLHYHNKIYQIDLQTFKIKEFFGGGSINDNTASSSTAQVLRATFRFDESDNMYYLASCNPTLDWDERNYAYKLMKMNRKPDGSAGSVEHIAGNCVKASVSTAGVDPLTSSFGTGYYYAILTDIAIYDNGNKILFCNFGLGCLKIINGVLYRSSLSGGYGFYVSREDNKTYWAYNHNLYDITINETASFGDSSIRVISADGTGNCLDDDVDALSACSKINYTIFKGPNNSLAFVDGTANNTSTYFRVRRLTADNKIKTIAGSLPFYGDGLTKSLARGTFSGIYYKKASEANQAAFPEGLYFLDKTAMVMGYINPSTDNTEVIWGTQSGLGYIANGDTMSTASTMGSPYRGGDGQALTFNDSGLPLLRVSRMAARVNADHTVSLISDGSGKDLYHESLVDGDQASKLSLWVYGGVNNFTAKDNNLFVTSSYLPSTAPQYKGMRLFYLDYAADYVHQIMGDVYANGLSADDATAGSAVSKTFDSRCNHQSTCYFNYEKSQDRLYYTEGAKLRYIQNPTDSANASLHTLKANSRVMYNFIFSEDKTMVFYISSGELYCYNISSGNAWCDNSSLGPSTGLSAISNGANQMTWKDANTLLISTYTGEILEFKFP